MSRNTTSDQATAERIVAAALELARRLPVETLLPNAVIADLRHGIVAALRTTRLQERRKRRKPRNP